MIKYELAIFCELSSLVLRFKMSSNLLVDISENTDIEILIVVLKFCSVSGVLPFYNSIVNKIFNFLQFFSQICIFIFVLHEFELADKNPFNIKTCLFYSIEIFSLLYSLICYDCMLKKKLQVYRLVKTIFEIDLSLKKNHVSFRDNVWYKKLARLVTFCFFILATVIFQIGNLFQINFHLTHIHLIILTYQLLLSLAILNYLIRVLETRYKQVHAKLKANLIFVGTADRTVFKRCTELKKTYFLLYDCIKIVNELFGMKILIVLIITFFEILNLFEICLIKHYEAQYLPVVLKIALELVSNFFR